MSSLSKAFGISALAITTGCGGSFARFENPPPNCDTPVYNADGEYKYCLGDEKEPKKKKAPRP